MKGYKGEKLLYGLFNALIIVSILLITTFTRSDDGYAQFKSNDSITISINISEKSMVDINPANLSYGPLPPGSVGDSDDENIGNYSGIWIENIGSTNITKIWFNNTYPSERPFGSGDPLKYDAGNFVVIANESTGTYYFSNRVEYPRTDQDTLYVTMPTSPRLFDFGAGDIFGRFRNASFEYFWAIETGSSGNCSDGTIYYSGDAHTMTETGDVNLDDGNPSPKILISTGVGWSATNITFPAAGGSNYCVSVPDDCSKVIFHRWNADIPGAGGSVCAGIGYFLNSSVSPLFPGNVTKGNIKVHVPYGVPMGAIKSGLLTVYVTSD
ncbi:MAG: hypothetical protein V1718_03940 [archaeon]